MNSRVLAKPWLFPSSIFFATFNRFPNLSGMSPLLKLSGALLFGLPLVAAAQEFIAAPEPPPLPAPSPLAPEAQRASFTLPPGFTMELVAADPDIEKVVAINFDHAGRLWAVTATEYPVDGNEQPEEARQLYAQGGKDRVLIFDDIRGTNLKPRVFLEGMAIPLGVLPLSSNKVIIAQGPDIFTLTDTDGDGRGDKREVLLTGFGVQDSHLMPHGLIRGPGDWIYFAQGAFNYSQVRTKEGTTVQFDQCKVGRFKLDGSQFEIVGWGLNNIWGFVISRHGEMFIQEANDLGYPMVPFQVGANYPGIGMHKAKPYAPWQPPLANHFQMGGTGLSGLALAEGDNGFSGPYRDQFYLANPITSKMQAIHAQPDSASVKLSKLPDFALTQDQWFRPVAMQFGPDGCLYIVDWYNKIISHNEVPRTHPERDKSRSRIWRIRQDGSPGVIANLETATSEQLLAHLKSDNAWAGDRAWQRVVDARATDLAPALRALALDGGAKIEVRLRALWALEGLQRFDASLLKPLLADPNFHVRREAVRVIQSARWLPATTVGLLQPLIAETHPQVRAEIARTLARSSTENRVVRLLLDLTLPPLAGPTVTAQQGGGPILTGAAADRAFERYLIRAALEKHKAALPAVMEDGSLKPEAVSLAALTLDTASGAAVLARALPSLERPVSEEECILLARFVSDANARTALQTLLANPAQRGAIVDHLWNARDRIDLKPLAEFIRPAIAAYKAAANFDRVRFAELAGAFRVEEQRPAIEEWLLAAKNDAERLRYLRALSQFPAASPQALASIARSTRSSNVQLEAVSALSKQPGSGAADLLIELWLNLALLPRHKAIEALASTATRATTFLAAIQSGAVDAAELDSHAIGKLASILPDHPAVKALSEKLAGAMQVARFTGAGADQVPTGLSLVGAFTVEGWVRLEEGINNQDALAGSSDWDFNFHDGKLRFYAGPELGDAVIAAKPLAPNTWTHFAITRSAAGDMRLYVNGALSASGARRVTRDLPAVVVGQSMAVGGPAGEITEFRIWNRARSANELLSTANITFADSPKPSGLVYVFPGAEAKLGGAVRLDRSTDVPAIQTPAQAAELEKRFTKFRELAARGGNHAAGREVFAQACAACHSVQGEGGQIGPALNGAGAMGIEALLRSTLTPNAMMESGYRRFHVERKEAEAVEGFLVSDSGSEFIVRPLAGADVRIPASAVHRAYYSRTSLMPEGLLEAMTEQQVTDLFAYLSGLK